MDSFYHHHHVCVVCMLRYTHMAAKRQFGGVGCFLPYGSPRTKHRLSGSVPGTLICQAISPVPFLFETGSSYVVQDGLEITSNSLASVLGFRYTLGLSLSLLFSFFFSLLVSGFLVETQDRMHGGQAFYQRATSPSVWLVCLSVFISFPHPTFSCSRR